MDFHYSLIIKNVLPKTIMLKKESTIKLCILGSSDLEILSFIRKITPPLFESDLTKVIGVEFYAERLNFNTNSRQFNIKINFYVMSSEERFRVLIPSYLNNSDGFIILLNLSEMKGYQNAKYWISLIREKFLQTPILLIAYSINEREVSIDLIQKVVNEPSINYIELSLDNEIDVRGSIILLSCIILHLQIPYDIQQRLNFVSYFSTYPYSKGDKEVLTQYVEATTSFTSYKYSYTEFLQGISTILDNPDLEKIEPHLERLKDYIDVQEIKVNSMKGKFLEMNTRLLYEREYGYEIDYTEKDFECRIDEIEVLYDNRCLKSRDTKDIQIDIFGKKPKYGSDITYLIGECKDRNKKISLKEINCFIIKARIIATFYLYIHQREKKPVPKFHLFIVSLHGFPDKQKINKILEDSWQCSIPKKRILNESIDLLAKKKFIDLLKKNNISIKPIQ